MKYQLSAITLLLLMVCACGDTRSSNNATARATSAPAASVTPAAPASPAPTASIAKNGDYDGKGVVTKINMELGSVEMDHEDIPGLMPPMRMEFYVTDKKMLDGLKVGDRIDFVLRYKDRTETIVKISKSK